MLDPIGQGQKPYYMLQNEVLGQKGATWQNRTTNYGIKQELNIYSVNEGIDKYWQGLLHILLHIY